MKILVFTEKPFAPAAVKAIEDTVNASGNELEVVEGGTREDFLAAMPGTAGLIVRSDKVDGAIMDASNGSLKVIVRAGAGYDNIDLEDIAAAGNISRSKCCQIFKKYMQQSPVAYLNAYRMELSCNLLKTTSYSITSIATSCGYNHLSYFSKIFLKKFGCTPMEYRKKFKSC